MLAALDSAAYAASGWTIDVLGGSEAATFDPTTKKVNFTVRTTRGGVSDLELNVLGRGHDRHRHLHAPPASPPRASTSTDPTTTRVQRSPGAGSPRAPRHGTIKDVTSSTALTLTTDGWTGGQPANGTVFPIEAADPKTGAPELADTLEATAGIKAANADVSTATMTPERRARPCRWRSTSARR